MAKSKKADAIKIITADETLAYHLEKAEDHLIEAVRLFELKHKPERHHDFVGRLIRAQEMVTTLLREELVRKRGPMKVAQAIDIKRKRK